MKTKPGHGWHLSRRTGRRHARTHALGTLVLSALIGAGGMDAAAASMPVAAPLGSFSSGLTAPARIAITPDGGVLVCEPQHNRIGIFDAFGRLSRVRDGFATPTGIAVDGAGRIHVAEAAAGRVRIFDAQWNPLGHLGAGDGEFLMPNFIAAAPEPGGGTVFVSDARACQVRAYTNGALAFAFGSQGAETGRFDFVTGLWATTNELFVVDQINDRIQVFDLAGNHLREFSLITRLAPGLFGLLGGRSQGICGDEAGRVFVADAFQCVVRVFDTQGNFLGTIGGIGDGLGMLRSPDGLALDPLGRLLVASRNTGRVEIFGLDTCFHLVSSAAGPYAPAGGQLRLEVIATGAGPYTWQWRKGGTNLVDGGAISGAQTASLAVTNLTAGDAGSYSVVINGPEGTFICQADPLLVLEAPAIVTQPSDLTVPQGAQAGFSVVAQGDALSYQWTRNNEPVGGQTNSVLAIAAVQPDDRGTYAVVVSNPLGSAISEPAVLAVITPPVIVHDPTDQLVIEGGTAGFFAQAQGDGLSYRWQFNGLDLPAAIDTTLEIPAVQALAAGAYCCVASNAAGVVTSAVANLSVLIPPAVNEVAATALLPDGSVALSLHGVDGYAFALDASVDLITWIKLGQIATTSGVADIVDLAPTNEPLRFYRLRWKP